MQNTEHTRTQEPVNPIDKWADAEYRYPFTQWTHPPLVYTVSDTERDTLHALKNAFTPLPIYPNMQAQTVDANTLVQVDAPIPDGYIAFLENTAEKCTSPQSKHSREGMQGARHWVQRVDTPDGMFRRLADGYGVSLMFAERHYQYIRNRNNWRGISGMMLDIDVFRDTEHPDAPPPVYSQDELFDRYPLLSRICTYLMPSASSLYDGRPYKARGIILFDEPITDRRLYSAFGDILLSEIDCIPANVTKNASAVGFGNTHNARQAYRNPHPDNDWIVEALERAKTNALKVATRRNTEQKHKAKLRELYNANGKRQGGNISEFIKNCDAVSEMVRDGLITPGRGNEYKWHSSQSDRSCEILGDGVMHIFSGTMQAFSPAPETEPVNAHRFYLYQLANLDLAKESDKDRCREYLFERGYGRDPKAYTKRKLVRNTDDEPPAPVPTETLDENRENRAKATDAFLTSEPTPERLNALLIRDDTGTGKSQTILTKAPENNKRTLANYQHTDLAHQAVYDALRAGYTNPCHLLGREHNWDESRIESIPAAMRTKDLFDRNNCIMADEVRKYTNKRIAPRTYCETKCTFRDGCPHLAQYEGLGERDFIATCTPNLLFDLNFRGYLKSLVSTTAEPTDEMMAIDAVLGTTSEATDNFDFAILDDYGISALYSDVVLTGKEFKALRKAWKGTPAANFAKGVQKAFAEKKPKKIVKALRNALDSTSQHHAEISQNLTRHARHGVVEYTQPKGSKESRRLLAEKRIKYDDGGMQFIPVDAEAYAELREKDIPAINPERLDNDEVGSRLIIPHATPHALIAGVPLSDLTPVWQRGATPIELLQIFLASIGNPANAPIARTFRVSKNPDKDPDPVLTFSIPPQAPVGILPQIAMLSATTNPDDVIKAFQGQSVDFTTHKGGVVEWAKGVQVYQFADARITSASVFEYPTDAKGKRKLDEMPTGLTQTAQDRIEKLNTWAKTTDGVTAFISYKDFLEPPFCDALDGFDVITHFDKVSGLNFEGLKYLVVFGYPKVRHIDVMANAIKQFAHDTDPLPKGTYDDLTEQAEYHENGLTIAERRYKDARLDTIRTQLATEKLDQANGRARLPVWTDTKTIVFTNSPINRITERATLFTRHAFNMADTPDGLCEAMDRIDDAEASGNAKAVSEAKGVSERTARRQTQSSRETTKAERDDAIIELHNQGKSQREIERLLTGTAKASRKVISNVIKGWCKTDTTN